MAQATEPMRVDAHQHFWRYSEEEYGWINDAMAGIRRDFLPADLLHLLKDARIDATVAVQAHQVRPQKNCGCHSHPHQDQDVRTAKRPLHHQFEGRICAKLAPPRLPQSSFNGAFAQSLSAPMSIMPLGRIPSANLTRPWVIHAEISVLP